MEECFCLSALSSCQLLQVLSNRHRVDYARAHVCFNLPKVIAHQEATWLTPSPPPQAAHLHTLRLTLSHYNLCLKS